MSIWIALLRGINVGGKHRLPMKELVDGLQSIGLKQIRTYIQSGNVVFQSDDGNREDLASQIGHMIEGRHGFRPMVLLLGHDQLAEAARANPFPEAEERPNTLHLSFLATKPKDPDLRSIQELCAPSERFQLIGATFYLHAPEGIGRSKLATKAEKLLGVPATSRNWRTIQKLLAMAETC